MKEMGIMKETDQSRCCSLPGPPNIKWSNSWTHSLEIQHHGMLLIYLHLHEHTILSVIPHYQTNPFHIKQQIKILLLKYLQFIDEKKSKAFN